MIVVPSSLWKIIQISTHSPIARILPLVSLSRQPAMQVRNRARRSADSASDATRQGVSPERPALDQTRRARALGSGQLHSAACLIGPRRQTSAEERPAARAPPEAGDRAVWRRAPARILPLRPFPPGA